MALTVNGACAGNIGSARSRTEPEAFTVSDITHRHGVSERFQPRSMSVSYESDASRQWRNEGSHLGGEESKNTALHIYPVVDPFCLFSVLSSSKRRKIALIPEIFDNCSNCNGPSLGPPRLSHMAGNLVPVLNRPRDMDHSQCSFSVEICTSCWFYSAIERQVRMSGTIASTVLQPSPFLWIQTSRSRRTRNSWQSR